MRNYCDSLLNLTENQQWDITRSSAHEQGVSHTITILKHDSSLSLFQAPNLGVLIEIQRRIWSSCWRYTIAFKRTKL